jgi:hypothetical protein
MGTGSSLGAQEKLEYLAPAGMVGLTFEGSPWLWLFASAQGIY